MGTARRTWVEQVMGMPVSLLARGADLDSVDRAVEAVYEELRRVDAVFSPYREDSEVSRVGAGTLAVADAAPDVQDVAARCLWWRDLTDGCFDAVRPDGVWDPSGLVKGWAVERAARLLPDGVDWCLNAGGDVLVRSASGEPFRVGIEDPRDRSRTVAVVALVEGGVATSGTAARGAHLYDPRTGASVGALASVTVTGPSLEVADVLATAAFVAGALRPWTPGYEALVVGLDGETQATQGWPRA